MKSSYKTNNLGIVFQVVCACLKPKKIVEFGILEGFSLNEFINNSSTECFIEAYDLFEDFPYNSADFKKINDNFAGKNIKIEKKDFFKSVDCFDDNSIDIIHIDIANDGEVYEFAVNNYMKKLNNNGAMILEGGSVERDEYDWMVKYKKKKINPYLKSISGNYNVKIIDLFPSLTIITKK